MKDRILIYSNGSKPRTLRLQAWLNTWSTSQAVFTLVLVLISCTLAIVAASLL
jgi:hypothetical protein